MIHHNLENENSILNTFVTQLRDVNIQKDSLRFRRNIERIGEILGYELSKYLEKETIETITPLGKKKKIIPKNEIVLCSVLRAGLPLHNGLLNYFDNAESAFISAYRHHQKNDDTFEIIVEYFASPAIENKTLLLIDPMLATGKSLVAVYNAIVKKEKPKQLHIVSAIGAKQGVEFVENHFPENTHLWIAAIDNELNSRGYIIPGLGDAGDLAFGKKL